MLDIGEARWEFVIKQVDALMRHEDVQRVANDVYLFATREDIDVSTLAIACQIVRELRRRQREGETLTQEAARFIEAYERSKKDGRSIKLDFKSQIWGPMMFSGYMPYPIS